jgi:tetraacyldisaccharide 4'-kinase
MNLLSPFGWLYGRAANVRNTLYDRGTFASQSLGARTISIGNITAGGTGKTPLVALVAGILAKNGENVCILTRGYGRRNPSERVLVSDGQNVLVDAKSGGDEPVELALKLIGKALVVANADRVAAAKWALEKFSVTTFVLDDGFQHRRAKRDLDIVCIDATNPFGGGKVLPAGLLREPVENLRRANAVVVTRSNLVESTDEIVSVVRNVNKEIEIFGASNASCNILKLEDFLEGSARLDNDDDDEDFQFVAGALLFCALGNPENLLTQLQNENFSFGGIHKFPDHHFYAQADIRMVEAEARNLGCKGLLTTAKDAVKLDGLELTLPCFVVLSELEINDPQRFSKLITAS